MKEERKEWYFYLILFLIVGAGIIFVYGDQTWEMVIFPFANFAVAGIFVKLILTFDFQGINFKNEILNKNVSAGLVVLGFCILAGLILQPN